MNKLIMICDHRIVQEHIHDPMVGKLYALKVV